MDYFTFDERLGIPLPTLSVPWEQIPLLQRSDIIAHWEMIRSHIPDRIRSLEVQLVELQRRAAEEDDWDLVCEYYRKLSSLASCVNDLHLWYRTQPTLFEEL